MRSGRHGDGARGVQRDLQERRGTGDEPVSTTMTSAPFTIDADATLDHADDRMRQRRIRHLVVTSAGAVVGVLSERDILFVRAFEGVDPSRATVRSAMSPCAFVCDPSTPLRVVARQMADGRFGACVVARGSKPVGIVTTVDLCRRFAEELDADAVGGNPIARVVALL